MNASPLPLLAPVRDASLTRDVLGHRWHFQRSGDSGPRVLMLHGTGASSHSFTALRRMLSDRAVLLAPDLPGQGDTAALEPRLANSAGFARALSGLLEHEGFEPDLVVAHSAGVAVAVRLALAGASRAPIVGLCAALLPLGGAPGVYFAPLARALAERPWMASLLARRARRPGAVERLIASTGSRLPSSQLAAYRALLADRRHIGGTLRMMANWDLPELQRALPSLRTTLTLVDAGEDRTLPRGYAERVARALPGAQRHRLEGLGHLAHEEAPERVAALLDLPALREPAPVLPFERRCVS